MKHLYDIITATISKKITLHYTTSFSIGIHLLDKKHRQHLYDIYAFVRVADEIVDSFLEYDREQLLEHYIEETYRSITNKISANPVLHRFQYVVNKFSIDREIIESFFHSMRLDVNVTKHEKQSYETYIHGSAEVVGLMCLKVLVDGNESYMRLKKNAQILGSILQKVNFLRDLHIDYYYLHRTYFPSIDISKFDETSKQSIIREIYGEFTLVKDKIQSLDKSFRYAIYAIYRYYFALYKKIKRTPAKTLLQKRVRIGGFHKLVIYIYIRTLKFFRL